jgi:mitochondrial chaperone BCS1
MLDIYVVSLSSSWINDSTLTTLMGRVPARCIVLLEDLDAAFTRSVTRDDGSTGSPDKSGDSAQQSSGDNSHSSHSRSSRSRHKDPISDVNTLSLSGLLNALDGVAAAEGRLLFATTNHLERLDPALSRPGRMDVWIEFKNATKWQAEALFKNFFPSSDTDEAEETDVDEAEMEAELEGIEIPTMPSLPLQGVPVTPVSTSAPTASSSSFSALNLSASSTSLSSLPSTTSSAAPPSATSSEESARARRVRNEEEEHAIRHAAPPLSNARLAELARIFSRSMPEDEFSVAALQGCESPQFYCFWFDIFFLYLLVYYGDILSSPRVRDRARLYTHANRVLPSC